MACLKCGSDWKTLKGKDMVSCPECCKQQRCKARRQGRLPASKTKACERCGKSFEATGGNAIVRSTKCAKCVEDALRTGERKRRYRDRVKAGLVIPRSRDHKRLREHAACAWCGKKLTSAQQKKYCSKKCFFDARKAGRQSWDRTSHLESIWHRGGLWACAPSRKPLHELLTAFPKFVTRLKQRMATLCREPKRCLVCSAAIADGRKKFCSVACLKSYSTEVACARCGCPAVARGTARKAMCVQCRELSLKEQHARQRNKYGRNHRARARYHGVAYVAFPVRMIYERDGYNCQLCGRSVLRRAAYRKRDGKIHPRSPTIDHIVPMSKGGNHEPSNCQTACFICNTRKSDKVGGQLRLALA